jgi:hypothetical protein
MRRDIHIASATGPTLKETKKPPSPIRALLLYLVSYGCLFYMLGSRKAGEGFRAMQMRLGLPMSTTEQRPVPPSQPYYSPTVRQVPVRDAYRRYQR